MNTRKTKIIVHSGLFVAFYAIFLLASKALGGGLESTFSFLLPIPMVLFTCYYGYKYALIPFVASFLVGFAIDPLSALFYILGSNIIGIVYGAMIKKNAKTKYIILVSMILSLIVNLLTMIIFANIFNYSIKDDIVSLFSIIIRIFKFNFLTEPMRNRIIIIAIPLFLLAISVIQGYSVHLFSTIVLRKMKIRDNGIGNFYLINMPKSIGILYTIFFCAHFGTIYFLYTTENKFLLVICIILAIIYWLFALITSVQACVTVPLYLRRFKYSKLIIILLLILFILFIPIFIFIYSIIGTIIIFNDIHNYLLYNNK